MTHQIPDAAVQAMLLALAQYTNIGPNACRTGIAAALPHLVAERDAEITLPRDIGQQLLGKLEYVSAAFKGDKQICDTLIPAIRTALEKSHDR